MFIQDTLISNNTFVQKYMWFKQYWYYFYKLIQFVYNEYKHFYNIRIYPKDFNLYKTLSWKKAIQHFN